MVVGVVPVGGADRDPQQEGIKGSDQVLERLTIRGGGVDSIGNYDRTRIQRMWHRTHIVDILGVATDILRSPSSLLLCAHYGRLSSVVYEE